MKVNIHKGLLWAVVATAFASLWAAPVTCDQARTAAGNWLRTDPALGCRLGRSVDSARTCATTNGVNFHVVKLAGGGFVVMSAETTQEPVVAFSDSNDLVESADNPLWVILQHDFSLRARTPAANARAVSVLSAAEAKWAKLLEDVPTARSGNGIASVSDERVGEILRSKWGQTKNSVYDNYGENCYNRSTPNNYPCGCVATCMAQIMRHNCYPSAAKVVTRTCKVSDVNCDYTTSGTPYDWANMPLIPEVADDIEWYDGGSSSAECAAIGKLTYECGIAMQMQWDAWGSSSFGAFAFEPLTNVFRYANARCYLARDSGTLSIDLIKQIMLPNLDAGYPVLLGIYAHEVIADGYGFSGEQLYTHLNMGWCGMDNAWYNLPYVEPAENVDYSSSIVNSITYNIFPNETGELLSGRVVAADGIPIENALVSVSLASTSTTSGGTVLATTLTNGRGIYFFRLQGGKTYRVTASVGELSQSLSSWLPRSINPSRVDLLNASYSIGNMAAGNSWGNDFVFNGIASVATPEINPPTCLFHPATNVTITCATSGATIRYTLDGSDPDATSPEFWASSPIVVTADTTIKARAFKDGLNPSAIVTATYTYDISQDAPLGDYYANPIVISGTEGSYSVPDNSSYTLEAGEPYHSNYYQYHSIWYSWTAPGSGTMTFNARIPYSNGSILAVYVGDTMATAERLVFNTGSADSSGITPVSLEVEQGTTYHIVSASFWDPYSLSVQLSWSGNLTVVPDPDPTVPPEPRTLYVNAALLANATQDGLTPTTAFHDLPAAMAILQDGDTVLVAPGTYSPAVVTVSNVTIKATGTVAETIIDGGGINPCCWDTHAIDSFPRCLTAEFEGFTLVNGRGVVLGPNQNPFGGGAIGVKLSRCVISNCVANVAAGAYCCELRNCLVVGNTATTYAGGLGDCTLVGCTVYGNSASNLCGGIDFHCVATNSIIWGNHVVNRSSQSQDDVEDLYFEDPDSGLERLTAQLDHCCSSSQADGVGNIAGNPKFYDAAAGDFRLRPNSPCLDVGTPADIPSTETDLAGSPRIQGGALDMGAYEGAFAILGIRLLSEAPLWYDETEQIGSVVLECDGAWYVWCDADWIVFHAMPQSGDATLEFTILANNTGLLRTAEVFIFDDTGNIVSFQIGQDAAELRTLYVNAALPANMQQDGLSATTAFHDLPAAMAILRDGDTVLVAPGTYSPAVVTVSNVTIKATGAVAETIIDGGGTNACCSVNVEDDSASATFEGFTLVNGGGVAGVDERYPTRLYGGGALFVTLTRCIISNCVADVGGGAAGCDLRNCLIVDNGADFYAGGAAESVLVGCTVAGNSAEMFCGGIDCDCVATNCIIWGNAVGDGSSPDFEDSDYGAARLAYSCSSSLAVGDGNLAADPKFRDVAAGDFRLRLVSPCLDVGTEADITTTETDLAGNMRVQGGAPDMGAYEGVFAIPSIRLLSDSFCLYSASAQTGSVTFECDSSWQVACTADWITFRTATGFGDMDAFRFVLQENTANVARNATIVLVDGANNAVAVQVEQAAAAVPPAVSNRYFGLFVGLGKYDAEAWRAQGFNISNLPGTILDATNMCVRFTDWGFCRREDALVLTNNLATVSAIRTALTNIAAQAIAGDTVLYYHSGHGYLSAGTTVALIGYENFYWDYDLASDLELFADGVRVVVMADTCHSGGLFKGGGTRGRRTFNLAERVQSLMSANRVRGTLRGTTGGTVETPRNLASPSQIGWITAADYDQSSWDTASGGRFTLACLEGWRTGDADPEGDGRVNFYDLWLYAKDAGSATAASQGEETEGQCFNEELLMSVLAGVTDNSSSEIETFNTPVRVPYSWLARYMQDLGFTPSGDGKTMGEETYSFADYAAAAETTKTTARGEKISVWQDYVAGTDPSNSNSVFTASVSVTNGIPYISWTPDLGKDERDYIVYGREDLISGSWGPTNAASRFFKVEVRMK